MNLPVTTWNGALWWVVTMILLGFGWTLGCWLMARILGRFGK